MQFYDAVVRLNGNVLNEVFMKGVSAPELMILKDLHDEGGISDVVPSENKKIDHEKERQRLESLYGKKVVSKLFGQQYEDLPVKAAGIKVAEKKRASAPDAKEIVE